MRNRGRSNDTHCRLRTSRHAASSSSPSHPMAKLSDIAIYLDFSEVDSEQLDRQRTFNRTAVPVKEIFVSKMDSLVLDGRGRLNIFLNRSSSRHREYEPLPARMEASPNTTSGTSTRRDSWPRTTRRGARSSLTSSSRRWW